MTEHRIPRADIDVALRQIVRGGEAIDTIREEGDEYVVLTEDRIETRLSTITPAARLGGAA